LHGGITIHEIAQISKDLIDDKSDSNRAVYHRIYAFGAIVYEFVVHREDLNFQI
jgi:hypothetical protein